MNESQEMIAYVLFGVAAMDLVVGQLFVAPRIKDDKARGIVRMALLFSALLMAGLGVAFKTGMLGR